jgi:hypothetical protein
LSAAAFVVILLLLPPQFLDGLLDDAMRVLEEEEALESILGDQRRWLSHLISEEKPNASHMFARIKVHTYDRQNECNIVNSIQT